MQYNEETVNIELGQVWKYFIKNVSKMYCYYY